MITSFIGFGLEVLFFIYRIDSNTDLRFPERTDRLAACEIWPNFDCVKEINGTFVLDESCLDSDHPDAKIDPNLGYAILNKKYVYI